MNSQTPRTIRPIVVTVVAHGGAVVGGSAGIEFIPAKGKPRAR